MTASADAGRPQLHAATQRQCRPLRGKKEIGLAVGKVLGRYKMGKHLQLTIEEDRFDWQAQTGKHRAGSGSGLDLCDSHQRARE